MSGMTDNDIKGWDDQLKRYKFQGITHPYVSLETLECLIAEIRRLRKENNRLQQELKGIGAEQFYDMRQRFWDSQEEVKRLIQDIESYPTRDAYEAACKALWKHRDRNEKLEKQNAELAEVLREIATYPPFAETNNGDRFYEQMRDEALEVLRKYGLDLPDELKQPVQNAGKRLADKLRGLEGTE